MREVAQVVQRDARRARPHRLAEDLRQARPACLCADPAEVDLRRSAPRGARARARGGAARAEARHQQMVEGRAPRRLRRLQPERQGPHRRRRVFGAADRRRRRVSAPLDWNEVPDCEPGGLHARDHAAALQAGGRPPRRHRRKARIARARCWSCSSSRARATRPGRRTTRSRRASRRGCSRPSAASCH